MNKSSVIFLMGPTCSGKTALAMYLADHFPVELISVDSAQVYKGMDIGTAKPDPALLARYPHALIDCCEPTEPYNASDFCADANRTIDAILARGNIPLLVGGTMMYFNALQQGLSTLPASQPAERERVLAQAETIGWPAMHEQLKSVDPVCAAKINPNDAQRIGRALEVFAITGRPMSELQQDSVAGIQHDVLALGLMPQDRTRLHALIEQRFYTMLEQGFLDEAKSIFSQPGIHALLPAIKSVGYRQAWDYLNGIDTEIIFHQKAIAATRQLAKRQITWLRSWDACRLYDPYESGMHAQIKEELSVFLSKI